MTNPEPQPNHIRLRLLAALIAAYVSGCGNQSPSAGSHSNRTASFAGQVLSPARPAPPLALRNYLGDPVNLTRYRGKAVVVTFLYTHCIDVCPLIAANLGVALHDLGRTARDVEVIAVSVDPRGDTRKTVAAFLKLHDMTGRMKYLLGTGRQLAPVWRSWHVSSLRDPTNRKLVVHSSPIFGVSATGKLVTVYGPTSEPAQIAHDIPKLLAS
jgi:protein SCO1/2